MNMNDQAGQDSGSYDPASVTWQAQPTEQSNPELDRILAELAGYTASNSASQTLAQPAPHSYNYDSQPVSTQAPVPAIQPSTSIHTSAPVTPQSQTSAPATPRAKAHQPKPVVQSNNNYVSTPPPQVLTPQIDPSTILEWPAALRCVNKISASNPQFGPKLKEMIADQDRNVKQWWDDRNNLINTQKTKNEGKRSLNEMLKGVGGKLELESTPEQDKAELDRFDKKVYNASQQMNKYHEIEMKRLGVPFFGVDQKYIIANNLQQTSAARNALSQATITEKELSELQSRMVQYLEDLYRD